jgi:hypothetical protein
MFCKNQKLDKDFSSPPNVECPLFPRVSFSLGTCLPAGRVLQYTRGFADYQERVWRPGNSRCADFRATGARRKEVSNTMKRAKSVTILVGLGATVIVVLASGLILMLRWSPPRGKSIQEPRPGSENSTPARIIAGDDKYNGLVRSEILGGNVSRVDSMGIRNYLPSDCNISTPLIELRTFERELDGTVQPLHLFSLGLLSQVPRGTTLSGGDYGVDACGLRVGLAWELDGSLYLAYDTEYTARGVYHRSEDPNNIVRGQTAEVRFRTPAKLAPGEIYRVDLILIDKIKEGQAAEQAEVVKTERARAEEDEKITLRFAHFPEQKQHGIWQAVYHDGNRSRGFEQAGDGTFFLKGPNKLGGELLVYLHTDEDFHPWLYVTTVQKRMFQFPADASIIVNEDSLVKVHLSLTGSDASLLAQCTRLDLRTKADARLPLFYLVPRGVSQGPQSDWQIDMRVLPCTYFLKLVKNDETESDLGLLNISNEAGKTYSVRIAKTPTSDGR